MRGPELLDEDGCLALIAAVMREAIREWADARGRLKKKPDSARAARQKAECEQFFLSEWLEDLCGLNGRALLERLEREERKGERIRRGDCADEHGGRGLPDALALPDGGPGGE